MLHLYKFLNKIPYCLYCTWFSPESYFSQCPGNGNRQKIYYLIYRSYWEKCAYFGTFFDFYIKTLQIKNLSLWMNKMERKSSYFPLDSVAWASLRAYFGIFLNHNLSTKKFIFGVRDEWKILQKIPEISLAKTFQWSYFSSNSLLWTSLNRVS